MTRLPRNVLIALAFVVAGSVMPARAQDALPDGWATADVGAVAAAGHAVVENGVFTVAGSGADVWGSADELHYAYTPLTGDGSIVAHVSGVQNLNVWTKAGVMMRESLAAGSRHAFMLVSPGKGLAFQRRAATGGVSTNTSGGSGTAPAYVKLTRQGDVVTAYRSVDGVAWTTVGSDTIAMGATVYVGLAMSSHVDGTLAAATFAQVNVTSMPDGWSTSDIGPVGARGRSSYAAGRFTVSGAGADVWGAVDELHYAYRQVTGDTEIVTRVDTVQNVNVWTKVGVMMRESLSPGSRHAFMLVSPGKGLAFQRRVATGGVSTSTSGGSGTAPYYLKLARVGDLFTASKSLDGVTWTLVGEQAIAMGTTFQVGLAVSSHVDATLAEATFTETQVTAVAPPAQLAPPPDQISGGGSVTPPPPPPPSEPPPPPPPAEAALLRVVHWNVHHGGVGTDGRTDRDRLTTWMASFNADVFSLNELDSQSNLTNIISRLQTKTGKPWYYSYDYGIAVVSRFPIQSGSSCLINSSLGRKIVQATLVVNGRTVNVWSLHHDAESATVRRAEVTATLACARPFAEQRIIAGDFNAGSTSTEITNMKVEFLDAWAQAKLIGQAINYSGNCDGCTRNGRIDYVFASKLATNLVLKSAQIFDTRDANGVMPSDHKPMLVVYEVR